MAAELRLASRCGVRHTSRTRHQRVWVFGPNSAVLHAQVKHTEWLRSKGAGESTTVMLRSRLQMNLSLCLSSDRRMSRTQPPGAKAHGPTLKAARGCCGEFLLAHALGRQQKKRKGKQKDMGQDRPARENPCRIRASPYERTFAASSSAALLSTVAAPLPRFRLSGGGSAGPAPAVRAALPRV